MTKAELVKGIADLEMFIAHSNERIAQAEAKIAELKDEIDEEEDTYNSAYIIKQLTEFVNNQEATIKAEKASIEDSERMLAEFTAEPNKIEATDVNTEANVEDYIVTQEAQDAAVQAEIDSAVNAEANNKFEECIAKVISSSQKLLQRSKENTADNQRKCVLNVLWEQYHYYSANYYKTIKYEFENEIKYFRGLKRLTKKHEAKIAEWESRIADCNVRIAIGHIVCSKLMKIIEAYENYGKADVEDYLVTPEAQDAAVQAEIDNAVNAEAAGDNVKAPNVVEAPNAAVQNNIFKVKVEIDGKPIIKKVSNVKKIPSAINNIVNNIFSNFGKLLFRASITDADSHMPLIELYRDNHSTTCWYFANPEYETAFQSGVESWLMKHTDQISAQIKTKNPLKIKGWLGMVGIDDGGVLMNCLARNYLNAYVDFNVLVNALIFKKTEYYSWVVDVETSLDFAGIVDKAKGANGEICKAVRNAIDIELLNESVPDETVDNNDDADEEEIVVETVDIDEDNELIDPPEIPNMALEIYSPPVEVQTADEVEAERIEKLQQLSLNIDAVIKANSADIDKISDAIIDAEIADEPTDDLSEVYLDLIDKNNQLRALKSKIENELTPAVSPIYTFDIEDDYYEDLWWKVPEFNEEADTKATKINLITFNAPIDAEVRQSIIAEIVKGTNNAIVNDDTITIGKLNVKLAPADEHLPTKEIIKRARQYFGLQAKSPVKRTKSSAEAENENIYIKKRFVEYCNTHKESFFGITGVAAESFNVNPADVFKLIQHFAPDRYYFDRIFASYSIFSNSNHTFGFAVDFVNAEFPLMREIVSSNIRRVIFGKFNDDKLISLIYFNVGKKNAPIDFPRLDYERIEARQKRFGMPIKKYNSAEYGEPVYGEPITLYQNAKGLEVKSGSCTHWKVESAINDKIATLDKAVFNGAFRIIITLNNNRTVTWQNINGESYVIDDSGNYVNVNASPVTYCREYLFSQEDNFKLHLPESPQMKKCNADDNSLYRRGGCVEFKPNDKIFKIELIPDISSVNIAEIGAKVEQLNVKIFETKPRPMGDDKYILDYYINNIKVSSDEWAETLQAARKGFCREIYLEPCRYSPRSSEDIPAAKLRYIWQKLIEYALDDITINKPVAKFNVRSPTKLLATAARSYFPKSAILKDNPLILEHVTIDAEVTGGAIENVNNAVKFVPALDENVTIDGMSPTEYFVEYGFGDRLIQDISKLKAGAKVVNDPAPLLEIIAKATALLEVKPATARSNTPKVHCTLDYTCAKHNTSTVFFDDNISVPP